MSADYHPSATVIPLRLDNDGDGDVAASRCRAGEARRLAAAMGDYLSAEQWHRQEQLLDRQLDMRNQGDASVWRS